MSWQETPLWCSVVLVTIHKGKCVIIYIMMSAVEISLLW